VKDRRMRMIADIWFYWTAAAVALVGARYFQNLWYARQLAKMEKEQERSDRAYLDDLVVGNPVGPRVQAWLYPTPQGGELRWKVRASCEAEAAEILSQSFRKEIA